MHDSLGCYCCYASVYEHFCIWLICWKPHDDMKVRWEKTVAYAPVVFLPSIINAVNRDVIIKKAQLILVFRTFPFFVSLSHCFCAALLSMLHRICFIFKLVTYISCAEVLIIQEKRKPSITRWKKMQSYSAHLRRPESEGTQRFLYILFVTIFISVYE